MMATASSSTSGGLAALNIRQPFRRKDHIGRSPAEHGSDLVILVAGQAAADPRHVEGQLRMKLGELEEFGDVLCDHVERQCLWLGGPGRPVLCGNGIRLTLQALTTAVDGAVVFQSSQCRSSSVPAGKVRSKDKDLHQKSSSSPSSSSSKSDSSSMWTLYWATASNASS